MLLQARSRGGCLGHRKPAGSGSGAPAAGRRVALLVRNAASSTPGGQGSSSTAKQPSSINSPTSRAATLTPQERRVLVESVAGVLQQPLLQQQQQRQVPSGNSSGTVAKDEPLVYFFSYGANMHVEMVSRRAANVGSRDPAFVVDPSVRLVFKHRGGQATLEALPAGAEPRFRPLAASQGQPCVHGVLYRLPASTLRQLHSRDQGYVLTQMEVETYDGQRVAASVFVSGALSKLPQEVVPPESYLRKLREGAGFNFLDPLYQAWLSSIETVPSAGLGSEYYNTPGRYISYSLLLMSLVVVGGYLMQHW